MAIHGQEKRRMSVGTLLAEVCFLLAFPVSQYKILR